MSGQVATTASVVERNRAALVDLLAQIKSMSDVDRLREVRANAEGVKAWAKVHGRIKEIRLDLLRVEVEALVRVYQLGGSRSLKPNERKAAEWLAAMTESERASLIEESGSATTAHGLCRAMWIEDELQQRRRQMRDAGIELATAPSASRSERIKDAQQQDAGVAAALANIVEEYTIEGEPFSIEDLADSLIEESQAAGNCASDPSLRQGVREVCRRAVRAAPIVKLGETILPRFITARTGGSDEFVRIPVENALVSHLDDMRAARREQLVQDQKALDRLDDVATRLRQIPGCKDSSRIGDLIARTVRKRAS